MAQAAQAALDTSHEFGRQARAYGESLIATSGRAGGPTGPMVTINEDLLTGYVGKRHQRRIMEIAARPGPVDKISLRQLGLTHDAAHGLADARSRGDVPAAAEGEAADQWWQAHEGTITKAAAVNQQARALLWCIQRLSLRIMLPEEIDEWHCAVKDALERFGPLRINKAIRVLSIGKEGDTCTVIGL